MLKIYPAIFHHEDGAYWVEFPDLPGCQSFGDTLEESMKMAQEALGLYIISKLECDENIPDPSEIGAIEIKEGNASYVATEIDNFRKKTKSVKKTLSIPQWLNEAAEKQNVNFSSTLQKALKNQLGL
jgi:predicted RNase H-like HicB family nuclease